MSKFNREKAIEKLVDFEVDVIWYRRDDEQNRESYRDLYGLYLEVLSDKELKTNLSSMEEDL